MPTTAEIRLASSAWSAPGTCTAQPADPEVLGQAVEVGDDPDERPTAPAAYGVVEVHAGRQSWSRSRQKRSQSPHGLLPCSKQRCVQVWASRSSSGPPTATTKPSAGRPRDDRGRAGVAGGGGEDRVADEPEASPPRPRHPPAHRVRSERDEVVGEQRARDPEQLVGASTEEGSTGRAPKPVVPAPIRGRSALPRPAAGAASTRSASRVRSRSSSPRGRTRRPGEVDAAQELELLGPGQRAARRLVAGTGVGPLQPRRRTPGPEVGDPAVHRCRRSGGARGGGHRSGSRRAVPRSRPATVSVEARLAASCVISDNASSAAPSRAWRAPGPSFHFVLGGAARTGRPRHRPRRHRCS